MSVFWIDCSVVFGSLCEVGGLVGLKEGFVIFLFFLYVYVCMFISMFVILRRGRGILTGKVFGFYFVSFIEVLLSVFIF